MRLTGITAIGDPDAGDYCEARCAVCEGYEGEVPEDDF
jgi:hypothetical protein